MMSEKEAKLTQKQNYNQLKELIGISFALGVNLTAPTRFKDSLRILNVFIMISAAVSFYGQWNLFIRFMDDIPKIAETICTALQTMIAFSKLIYYLFMQHKFYQLLHKIQTHEILQKCQIFQEDFPIKSELKHKINDIMSAIWKDIRHQLVFYIIACLGITSNYFFGALLTNFYHQIKQTPNYVPALPFPAIYPQFEDKGMSFPYYHIEMYLGGSAAFAAGLGAISFDGLFIVLCMHGVGLVQVLKVIIEYCTSPLMPKELRLEYLRCCIYQYQTTCEYNLEVKRIYKHISLTQFTLSLIVMGIVLFNMSIGLENSKVTVLRMAMYMMAGGYEVFIYCFNGQRLTSAYEEIPLAFYNCQWYDESKEFRQLLKMMIMRTSPNFELEVSWFATMSLQTLLAMVQASGSYFLLLRDISE